jgi:hypothetical protein
LGEKPTGLQQVVVKLAGVSVLTKTCVSEGDMALFTKMVSFGCLEAAAYLQQCGESGVLCASHW